MSRGLFKDTPALSFRGHFPAFLELGVAMRFALTAFFFASGLAAGHIWSGCSGCLGSWVTMVGTIPPPSCNGHVLWMRSTVHLCRFKLLRSWDCSLPQHNPTDLD